jgi:hypothetical protein
MGKRETTVPSCSVGFVPLEIHLVDKANFTDATPIFAVEILEVISQMPG